ncbi:MAG: hypothetical protein GXO09_05670 [Crenarchaeota archaeon]|nr:hypothetical protein [Thermoproteota archaeon]
MPPVIVYASRVDERVREIASRLYAAGFKVLVRRAGDVDEVVVVGPFGVARGFEEARIVVNQFLASSEARAAARQHHPAGTRT